MFKLLHWFNFRLGVVGYMVSSTQLGAHFLMTSKNVRPRPRSELLMALFWGGSRKKGHVRNKMKM